jgi:hypothetical protein
MTWIVARGIGEFMAAAQLGGHHEAAVLGEADGRGHAVRGLLSEILASLAEVAFLQLDPDKPPLRLDRAHALRSDAGERRQHHVARIGP